MTFSLRDYPLAAVRFKDVRQVLHKYLVRVLSALEHCNARNASVKLLDAISEAEDLGLAEHCCKEILGGARISHIPRQLAAARADLYVEQIGPWVSGSAILDLGCGNGLIGRGLKQRYGCDVTFADTVTYADPDVDLVRIEGEALPFGDESFDAVLLITALHHMRNPLEELADAARVTRHRIVVKESVVGVSPDSRSADQCNEMTRRFEQLNHEQQILYTCFVDWFYNRVLETGVDTPFGFRPTEEWVELLARVGHISAVVRLGIDDFLGALYHTLIVVDLRK